MIKQIQLLGMTIPNYSLREELQLAQDALRDERLRLLLTVSMQSLIKVSNSESQQVKECVEQADLIVVEDPEILSAIACHTTGKPNMSMLDKIVFIADYIEPGRDRAPGLPRIRALAFRDLDQALICILEDTLDYLKSTDQQIDPTTQAVLDFYMNREKPEEASEKENL